MKDKSSYSVSISGSTLVYLTKDNMDKKLLGKKTRFSVFAEIIKQTVLLNLQGEEPCIEYMALMQFSSWSRPYLNKFLRDLQNANVLKVMKAGNKKNIKICPGILSELNENVSDKDLPTGKI